ncbi:RNA binding domain protein,putative [Babesia caballi]|uniref:RNA binding domain protein,putative n=1 Tax=Babesia caballi TaxID=5871 RepID=A0AAV4M2G7_BABCB|nr:RNA binding domain protein,putative [Babesia caballi]
MKASRRSGKKYSGNPILASNRLKEFKEKADSSRESDLDNEALALRQSEMERNSSDASKHTPPCEDVTILGERRQRGKRQMMRMSMGDKTRKELANDTSDVTCKKRVRVCTRGALSVTGISSADTMVDGVNYTSDGKRSKNRDFTGNESKSQASGDVSEESDETRKTASNEMGAVSSGSDSDVEGDTSDEGNMSNVDHGIDNADDGDTRGVEESNEDNEHCEAEEQVDRSGVVFCSRIPPFMNLSKLRTYFGRYGKVGKIYAEPESMSDYKRRVKLGGNKKLKFEHGWIEFLDKAVAKRVAAHLNGQPVGEKKRHNFWRDDLWNLKYLPRYKFRDVMDYLHQHRNERKEKLSYHLAQSRKENYYYLEQLETEKRHKAIEASRRKNGLEAYTHKIHIRPREPPGKPGDEAAAPVPVGLLGAIVS